MNRLMNWVRENHDLSIMVGGIVLMDITAFLALGFTDGLFWTGLSMFVVGGICYLIKAIHS